MNLLKDIQNRIKLDFKENASKAMEILNNAIEKTEHLNNGRIIRCIIFLSEGNIEKLKHTINEAILDSRDIILWAEYSEIDSEKEPKRIHDFNNEF